MAAGPWYSSVTNAELVEAVYAELHRTQPDGVSYATFRLNDQVTFVHLVQAGQEPSPLLAIRAFGEFQAGIADRIDQGPHRNRLRRFFASQSPRPRNKHSTER